MNSAFVGYEELSRSRRVLSASVDNTLRDLLNSSCPTETEFINCSIRRWIILLNFSSLGIIKKVRTEKEP